jgi:hypothetical protein
MLAKRRRDDKPHVAIHVQTFLVQPATLSISSLCCTPGPIGASLILYQVVTGRDVNSLAD